MSEKDEKRKATILVRVIDRLDARIVRLQYVRRRLWTMLPEGDEKTAHAKQEEENDG